MRARRAAAAAGISLALCCVAGLVALAADDPGTDGAIAPSAGPTTSTAVSTSTTAPPPSSTSTTVAASTSPVTSPVTTSTTSTTAPPAPTIAPIVTHDARVGVGVLTPAAAVAAPVRVVIPSLGADGPVLATGVDDAGELAIPNDARQLVWWKFGPTPGAPGSAVIAGHVDFKGVLGVFDHLDRTPIGERITVTYDDGHEQVFVVTTVELIDKPAVAVNGTFSRDGEPLLRLITCGGEFDDDWGHYKSNVIVTAVPG